MRFRPGTNYNPTVVDRDTQIGSGSTDILLGGFHRDNLTHDMQWDWFTQLQLDVPVLIQAGYRPGVELNTSAGIDYEGWSLGGVDISPVARPSFPTGAATAAMRPLPKIPAMNACCYRPASNFTSTP
jgi:hypothetical protein